jgi:hypothetical protein
VRYRPGLAAANLQVQFPTKTNRQMTAGEVHAVRLSGLHQQSDVFGLIEYIMPMPTNELLPWVVSSLVR